MVKKTVIFSIVTALLILASIEAIKISRQTEQNFADAVRVMQGAK